MSDRPAFGTSPATTCGQSYAGSRYYCRLAPGHAGPHDCPADFDDRKTR